MSNIPKFIVTRFADVFSKTLKKHSVTFEKLAELCANPKSVAKSKMDLPLLKLARFGDVRSDKGSLRHDDNVKGVWGLEGDHDSGLMSMQEAIGLIQKAGIKAIFYTSPSHTTEKPRWRILVPFSQECAPEKRAKYMARLNGILNGVLAHESFCLSQTFYYGKVIGVPYESAHTDGDYFDVLEDSKKLQAYPESFTNTENAPKKSALITNAKDNIDITKWDLTPADEKPRILADLREALFYLAQTRMPGTIETFVDHRTTWISMGEALATLGDDGKKLWWEWSAHSKKWKEKEAERVWASFRPTRTNWKAVFALAHKNGWKNPASKMHSDAAIVISAAVERLAALPMLEYESIREEEAKALNIRVSVLDKAVENQQKMLEPEGKYQSSNFPKVEPWHEAVEGAILLDEIYQTVGQFIVCDEETKVAVTLWIVFSWLIDHVQVAPLAVITAPEKRCGKSQLLSLIGMLVRRPMISSNISPSAVFRVVESHKPTLLIDEADTFINKDNDEIRGIINSGHTRQTAYVIRNVVVGDNHEAVSFSTWGAKALAGIGTLPETIMDRAINLKLRRKLDKESVEKLRYADPELFKVLTQKLARFAEDNGVAVSLIRPVLPEELNDRAQDNWEPLLAIADIVQAGWPALAKAAAVKLSGAEQEAPSLSVELLADIKEVFEKSDKSKIPSAELIDELCQDDEKPWANYTRNGRITAKQLSTILKGYGIQSKNIKFHEGVKKGYTRQSFKDAFKRYLISPANLTATPLLTSFTEDLSVAGTDGGSATESLDATSIYAELPDSSAIADDASDLA